MRFVQAFSAWLCCQGHCHELVDAVKRMRNWQSSSGESTYRTNFLLIPPALPSDEEIMR